MIDSDYGFCHVLFVFKRTFLFYPLLQYNVLAKEDFCIMDTNKKRMLNIEKDWSESQKTFAALKLIEQLNKDKLLKGTEFKRILQNYISVVNLADFKIDFWEEDMKESFLASVGLFARRHYEHLKRTNPTNINVMRMNGTLEEYFKEFDCQAEEMYSQLVKQLAKMTVLQKN